MSEVRWRLADFLERRGITAYRLAKTVGGGAKAGTIYRLARRGSEPTRVDLPTLAVVLTGLRRVTGEDVELGDVLEFIEAPETPPAAEDPAGWSAASLSPPLEPYDWGPAGEPEGTPVHFDEREGFYIVEDGS